MMLDIFLPPLPPHEGLRTKVKYHDPPLLLPLYHHYHHQQSTMFEMLMQTTFRPQQ